MWKFLGGYSCFEFENLKLKDWKNDVNINLTAYDDMNCKKFTQ